MTVLSRHHELHRVSVGKSAVACGDLETGATDFRFWGSTEPSRILLELDTDAEMRDSEDEIASNVARVDVLSTQVV